HSISAGAVVCRHRPRSRRFVELGNGARIAEGTGIGADHRPHPRRSGQAAGGLPRRAGAPDHRSSPGAWYGPAVAVSDTPWLATIAKYDRGSTTGVQGTLMLRANALIAGFPTLLIGLVLWSAGAAAATEEDRRSCAAERNADAKIAACT